MRVDDLFMDEVEQLRGLMRPIPTRADAIRTAVSAELERRKRGWNDTFSAVADR